MPHLSSILCTLPRLQTLYVTIGGMRWPKVKLEHDQLHTVALGSGNVDNLVIIMPNLDDLHIDTCLVDKIEVASRHIVHLKFSLSLDG